MNLTDDPDNNICEYFELHGEDCETLVTIRRVSAAVSFIGCLFTILVSLLFRKFFYSFVQRIILYVSISALITSIGYLMNFHEGFNPKTKWCQFQACWITFGEWSLLLWVSFITVDLFYRAFREKSTKKGEWVYLVIGIFVPSLLAGLPFIRNAYGPAGPWCWITRSHSSFRFGIWYGPLFFIIIVLIVSNLSIFLRMKSEVEALGTYNSDQTRRMEEIKEGMNMLKFYPFIYLILSIIPCVNRIHNAVSSSPSYWLTLCHCIFSPLPGAVYALVLFLDEDTRHKLTSWNEIKTALMALTTKKAPIKEYSTEIISYGTSNGSEEAFPQGRRGSLNLVNKNNQLVLKMARKRAYSVSGVLFADVICPLGMSIQTVKRHGSNGSDIMTSEVEEEDDEYYSENDDNKHDLY